MRKQPQQARSREMVARIVDAGRQVLVDDGYEAFSTNRIAEVAGVSPGSVYQYFPDKAEILALVVEQYWEQTAKNAERALGDRIGELDMNNARPVIDALLAALEADPALLRVVTEELPQARWRGRRTDLIRRLTDLVGAVLGAATPPQPTALDAGWVIVTAMENLAIRWVLDQPSMTREQLIEELNALVLGYFGFRAMVS